MYLMCFYFFTKSPATCINVTILTVSAVAPGGDITRLARFAQNRFEMYTHLGQLDHLTSVQGRIVKSSFPKEDGDITLA